MIDQRLATVVIGGSQAGLAVGYFLKQRGLPFVILDENGGIGDAWRKRSDSLRLFTPGRYNGLPGMPFPRSAWAYPTKDEAGMPSTSSTTSFPRDVKKRRRCGESDNRQEAACVTGSCPL